MEGPYSSKATQAADPLSSCVPQPSGQQRAVNVGTPAPDITNDATQRGSPGDRWHRVPGKPWVGSHSKALPNTPCSQAMWLGFSCFLSRQKHFYQMLRLWLPGGLEGPLAGTPKSCNIENCDPALPQAQCLRQMVLPSKTLRPALTRVMSAPIVSTHCAVWGLFPGPPQLHLLSVLPTPHHQPQDLCTDHSLCQECSLPQISTQSLQYFLLFSCSVVSDSLWPHELQHARLPCPSLSHGACSNSCPVSQWCHPTISSSAIPFSPCPQYFPASGSSNESALHIRWPKNTSYRPLLKCPLIRKTSPDHHLMKSHLHLSLLHPLSLPCAVSPLRADHYLLGSIFSCLVVFLFIVSFCKSAPHEVLWGQGPYQSCLLLCPQFLE